MNAQARPFALTSATLNLSASPNVTPGLLRLAQVPLGPALTAQSAAFADITTGALLAFERWIEDLGAQLGSHSHAIRTNAQKSLEWLGLYFPDLVWAAIPSLICSNDAEVCARGKLLRDYLIGLELAELRDDLAGFEEQMQRISRAVEAGKVDAELYGEAFQDKAGITADLEAAKKDFCGTGREERRLNRLDRSDRFLEREGKLP